MTVKYLPKEPSKFKPYYTGDGSAAKLEKAMLAKKILSIGDIDSWKTRVNERGDERYAGLDIASESRAWRTLNIKKLSEQELKQTIDYERRFLTRFLIWAEIKRVVKNPELEDQETLQSHQLESLIAFNNAHRPISDRHFMGLPIPPYFTYDYDFDGMIYHHAWDKSVWRTNFVLPKSIGAKGRVSNQL